MVDVKFILTSFLILFEATWGIPKIFMFFFNKLKKVNDNRVIIPFAILVLAIAFTGEIIMLWLIARRILRFFY